MRRLRSGILVLVVVLTLCAVVCSAPPSAGAVSGDSNRRGPIHQTGRPVFHAYGRESRRRRSQQHGRQTGRIGRQDRGAGVRMPIKDGKPQPHPDDVAYIKSLKAGMSIRLKIFAVRGNMKSLRMQGPGEPVKDGS